MQMPIEANLIRYINAGAAKLINYNVIHADAIKKAAERTGVSEELALWRYMVIGSLLNGGLSNPSLTVVTDLWLAVDSLHEILCCADSESDSLKLAGIALEDINGKAN